MSPEAQRQAIAESVGWKGLKTAGPHNVIVGFPLEGSWPILDGKLVDPVNSLDAMFEVLKTLPADNCKSYEFWLEDAVQAQMLNNPKDYPHGDLSFWTINATAKQRAEAYLRCIGKWQETTKAAA